MTMNTTTHLARVAITGNTYPVKDQIRALGGRWDGERKAWMIPADRATEAQALVAGAPRSQYRPTAPSRCRECGAAASRYRPIYRSGVCKDCYLSEREEREMGY